MNVQMCLYVIVVKAWRVGAMSVDHGGRNFTEMGFSVPSRPSRAMIRGFFNLIESRDLSAQIGQVVTNDLVNVQAVF